LYEPILYQGYNFFFTGIPIFWYAVFDEAITKEKSVKDPYFYWPGPQRALYSLGLLWFSLFKGTAVAYFFVAVCFYGMDGSSIEFRGHNGSFWFDGTVLYGIVCTVANLWLI
jgi:hypothetical protein